MDEQTGVRNGMGQTDTLASKFLHRFLSKFTLSGFKTLALACRVHKYLCQLDRNKNGGVDSIRTCSNKQIGVRNDMFGQTHSVLDFNIDTSALNC